MSTTLIGKMLVRAAMVLVLLAACRVGWGQACWISGSGATNAAGNDIPIWTCNDGPETTNRGYVPPPQPDVWGAIAISSTLEWSTVWNRKSEAQAKADALSRCKATSKRNDCRVVVAVADVCVSLALSKPDRLYAVGGPTGATNYADANANLHCQRGGGHACAIATSFCADGLRHVLPMRDGPVVPYGRTPQKK